MTCLYLRIYARQVFVVVAERDEEEKERDKNVYRIRIGGEAEEGRGNLEGDW